MRRISSPSPVSRASSQVVIPAVILPSHTPPPHVRAQGSRTWSAASLSTNNSAPLPRASHVFGILIALAAVAISVAVTATLLFGVLPLSSASPTSTSSFVRHHALYFLVQVPLLLFVIHGYMVVTYSFVFEGLYIEPLPLLFRFCSTSLPAGVLALVTTASLFGLQPGLFIGVIAVIVTIQRFLVQYTSLYTLRAALLTQNFVRLGGRYLDLQWILLLLPLIALVCTTYVFTADVIFLPLWQSLAVFFFFFVLVAAHMFRVVVMRPLQARPFILFPLAIQSDATADVGFAFLLPFATSWAPIATLVVLRISYITLLIFFAFTSRGASCRMWILQTRRDRSAAVHLYRSPDAMLAFRQRVAHYLIFTVLSWVISSGSFALIAFALRNSANFPFAYLPRPHLHSSLAIAATLTAIAALVLVTFLSALPHRILADVANSLRLGWYLAALSYLVSTILILVLLQAHSKLWFTLHASNPGVLDPLASSPLIPGL
ncbi:uncharacterized protein AMSG_11085 [Thecamonas trahens ATCC 50062]|uniref:Uncharacterized protein n=1 Tax=Thecamonas trahens ATCC 50062 TaxID=461836 RepID=A0A0L0DV61_THETB|nr:hypothetical protein AMSG_11085 [Thecamonas trahens ATCC 50062]KNC55423.1 hypothetical protein AMSG_11085 [Thecamonas trahens ATCC 50062]|eukprot:XP_013752962.1 hypothetical protein AMSG_11085 [Thecamonas trahens ATCC 50062]